MYFILLYYNFFDVKKSGVLYCSVCLSQYFLEPPFTAVMDTSVLDMSLPAVYIWRVKLLLTLYRISPAQLDYMKNIWELIKSCQIFKSYQRCQFDLNLEID